MSTSLKEQLNRLAAPQTSILSDARRKASILFDSKEAATKDRKTIYELGISGLQELIALNSTFQQFEATLFDEGTLQMERSVELTEVNKVLDKNIRKFLEHLSPYFMLRPAHLCIEWLLRRFDIHQYNKQAFLALMLPYHETNIFVKCLQTIRINKADLDFNWLKPLQKPGIALSKTAIINRAASNPAFLSFICQSTMDTVKEMGSRAHLLQAHINFYASIVAGALNSAHRVEEWHIVAILPSLLKALSTHVVDFSSAAFIIISQLVSRTQLSLKLLYALISKVASIQFEQLRTAATLLLIWIFDTQAEMQPQLTDNMLTTLVQHKWLTCTISTLAKEGVAVHFLCVPLIQSAARAIQKQTDKDESYKVFLEHLLDDVQFPNATASIIINSFLDSYVAPLKKSYNANTADSGKNDVIELDSDDDMGESMTEGFQAWYSDYLKKLERQYPNAFDKTIKDGLKSNVEESSNRSKAIKMALRYRLKTFDADSADVYENLYHHTAKIRIFAIQTLISNLSNYQSRPQNYQLLKECLADRILDDSELVVAEVLKLSTKEFIDILGHTKFVEALFRILSKAQNADEDTTKWLKLVPAVLQHLTTQTILDHYDCNLILLALMPLLFPAASSKEACQLIMGILKSPLAEKIGFLKELQLPDKKGKTDFSANEFKKHFLDVISHSKKTPNVMELFQSISSQSGSNYFQQPTHFAHFLLLVTACLKQQLSASETLFVFTVVSDNCKQFTLKHMGNQEWQLLNKRNFIPQQLFSDFLNTLTRHTSLKNLHNWDQPNTDLECCFKILELLCKEAFSQEQKQEKLEWGKTLKDFLNSVFKENKDKLEFFLNFYAYVELPLAESYGELRIRAFKILNSMLLNKNNQFKLNSTNVFKVLVALNSQHETIRLQGIESLKCIVSLSSLEAHIRQFVEQVLQRHQEIRMDNEQFPLVLHTILKPIQKRDIRALQMNNLLLSQIMQAFKVEGASQLKEITFKSELLQTLKHLNDEQLLSNVIPLALNILRKQNSLQKAADEVKLLEEPYSTIYQLICERFDSNTIESILVDSSEAWQMFEEIFAKHDVFLAQQGNLVSVPCVLLATIDELTFEKMPPKYQLGFIKLIIKCVARAENDSILLSANKLLRRCLLDCKPLVTILENMCKKSVSGNSTIKTMQRKSTSNSAVTQKPQLQLQSSDWKEGVVLLELLENKKKLLNSECLVPTLFELLKLCLDVEEQNSVEYVKQLILSALLHCCQQAKLDGINLQKVLPKSTFRIDQIVQCVRATQNPQTHHNALLLLSHCAGLFPQEVLLNIVDIFTFMGSSVVRHDDAFSFHLINNIIDSLLPILVGNTSKQGGAAVIPVLKVFSDIMLDVPEHRRPALYSKLLETLNAEQYLWMFLCIVFEEHVIDDEKQRLLQKKRSSNERNTSEKLSKRLKIALNLTNSFPPYVSLQTCIELMQYIKKLPHCDEAMQSTTTHKGEFVENALFDVKVRTPKQLRHYKYVIMQFLSTFTNSAEFLQQISLLSEEEQLALKPYYQSLIIKILSYVPMVTTAIERSYDSAQTKFWKVILHHLHDVLDNAISLLSPNMFLVVVQGLMQHQLISIRKKVIELLISKLQKRDSYFDACEESEFRTLLKPLGEMVESILEKGDTIATTNETYFLQQTALIAIKLLSKQFALNFIEDFKAILINLTKITKKRLQVSKVVFATVIVTLVEITSNLKAHSLSQLPKFMPLLIEVLADQAEFVRQNGPDNVTLGIITGILKLFESLPLFLGPYITDIVYMISIINTRIEKYLDKQPKDQRSAMALQKINHIWTKIANEVPPRVLIPSCEKAYTKILASRHYADIGVLMKLLLNSITNTKPKDIIIVQDELCNFFMAVVEFRSQLVGVKNFDVAKVNSTESSILNAFVAWVLKLSESSFRPIYMRLCVWALKDNASSEKILTFFLLTHKIAEALKSLFVLFAENIIQEAANLLDKYNSTKGFIDQASKQIASDLLKSILNTLYNVFLYDSRGFVNDIRFKILMQPIVDQLENALVVENEELQRVLMACIAQLAVATSSDIMWKQLNQQVLLKTRTNVPEVRILSFNCCVEIARKLGEDFSTLLPETVPFIAELFEDENPRVEQNTRKSVQELEVILGETLQQYL